MKKRIINLILSIIFIFIIVIIVLNFFADLQFNSAKKLESLYLWQEAKERYQLAIRINPFNTQYLSAYGDFLRDKSLYQKDRIAWLLMAEKLYNRALELNPRCAEYALSSGRVKLELFLSDKDKFKDKLSSGLADLKRAFKNDPKGFNIAYSTGYTGMTVWDNLNAGEKKWVLERLKYSLKIDPEYGEHIYPYLWQATKDSRLLRKIRPLASVQEKKEELKRIERIKQGNLSQSWQGKSWYGDNIYEGGNMYWMGTVDMPVNIPVGKAIVKLQASGSPANGVWPHMIVELDGEEIGETFVENAEWKEYIFDIDTKGGVKVLNITFSNDGSNPANNEDRNLYLGEVKIIKNER
ncbi:MAG: carbohydrate-binding domain-containing protein [Candidatus Omnitrophota bacterium]|jgi:tetratricopeptide (TPR) repeat protein